MRYVEITQGDLVDVYARSVFEDTRRKAVKYGAMGSTIRAMKPGQNDHTTGTKSTATTPNSASSGSPSFQ
jgi:hypothetical protein